MISVHTPGEHQGARHTPGEHQGARVMSVMRARRQGTPDEGTPRIHAACSAPAAGRERPAFPERDKATVRNRRLFPGAVTTRVMAPEARTDPGRISDMVAGLSPRSTVDDSLRGRETVGLGSTRTDLPADGAGLSTVPTEGIGRARGQSVAWPDDQAIEDIGPVLGQDEMASYRAGQ